MIFLSQIVFDVRWGKSFDTARLAMMNMALQQYRNKAIILKVYLF